MKTTENYHFTLFTQHGRENVEEFGEVTKQLEILAGEKEGFVRLEVNPPIDGKRYLETIYDKRKQNFYVCILEDREEGQGFLECRRLSVPERMYKRLFKKKKFSDIGLMSFSKKQTGVWKSVAAEGVKEHLCMEPFEVTSELYGDKLPYGGDQGQPMKTSPKSDEGKVLRDVIKKYHPDYNDAQTEAMLKKLDSEGCGYVVVVNILLSHFLGREAEFEQKFGFPMYTSDGKLNYDLLLVDFYAATDNHYLRNGVDVINFKEDCKEEEKSKSYDYSLDVTGYGTTQEARNYRTQLYLKKKGVKMKIKDYISMCPGELRKLMKKGNVMISLNSGHVFNEDGSIYKYVLGHAMLITGITYDCRFIVSSWGRKFYVDPNENILKNGKRTKIYYQYFECC